MRTGLHSSIGPWKTVATRLEAKTQITDAYQQHLRDLYGAGWELQYARVANAGESNDEWSRPETNTLRSDVRLRVS
jgi:hypothetical protein